MIKERAMELVAALRSGKYKQTKGRLHDATGFCCLGVATDLTGVEWKSYDQADCGELAANGSAYTLSPEVMEHFGFWSDEGCRRDGATFTIDVVEYSCLASANDDGVTFDKIADYIEANWEAL